MKINIDYLKKSDVNEGRIKVNKLKEEDLEGETGLILRLRSRIFHIHHPAREFLVNPCQNHNDDQIDEGSSQGSEDLRMSLEKVTAPVENRNQGNPVDYRSKHCPQNHANL
jgi:hypothetical protein